MAYRVLLGAKAERVFRKLSVKDRERIREALLRLETDPKRPRAGADIKALRGTSKLWRMRVGSWRAVYGIHENDVLVTDIFPRGRGYYV
ncbi:MAG TPA: type II toxin-antitoxin system RelE/ParE family toxin [Candidatus Thermoplasmatota archaeon]|nr:type II toxin-antitoxin system RelE/ParE family toxin [Candidatus Thermoplasmatota archaeon]